MGELSAEQRERLAIARNIVNQILDESGASVERRQEINDRCDEFTARLIAEAEQRAAQVVLDAVFESMPKWPGYFASNQVHRAAREAAARYGAGVER